MEAFDLEECKCCHEEPKMAAFLKANEIGCITQVSVTCDVDYLCGSSFNSEEYGLQLVFRHMNAVWHVYPWIIVM